MEASIYKGKESTFSDAFSMFDVLQYIRLLLWLNFIKGL